MHEADPQQPGEHFAREPRCVPNVADLKIGQIKAQPDREVIAVIAYLQRLGTDIKLAPKPAADATAGLHASN